MLRAPQGGRVGVAEPHGLLTVLLAMRSMMRCVHGAPDCGAAGMLRAPQGGRIGTAEPQWLLTVLLALCSTMGSAHGGPDCIAGGMRAPQCGRALSAAA